MGRRCPLSAGLVALAALAAGPTVAHDASMHATAEGSAMTFPEEAPFLAENSAAMDKMMAGMNVKPTGDVDADFSAMMIPHHQGAIDMAVAYLRYGKNEQLRRIAQEIIVGQQQEIAAMRLALGKSLPPSIAAPTQPEAFRHDAGARSPGHVQ
jgi:uncharacterized protein (DUF305 family)